jgi:hypothetical protein
MIKLFVFKLVYNIHLQFLLGDIQADKTYKRVTNLTPMTDAEELLKMASHPNIQ